MLTVGLFIYYFKPNCAFSSADILEVSNSLIFGKYSVFHLFNISCLNSAAVFIPEFFSPTGLINVP